MDDFESYTDDMKAGQAVFQIWLDGYGWHTADPNYAGNGTGSIVGHDILNPSRGIVERLNVNGGVQAMPLYYDNMTLPYYSEAERMWETPQDSTLDEADTLTLYLRGEAGNSSEPLYVAIEDSAGQIAVVTHPDADAVLATEWQKWHIAFADLTAQGVNVAEVKKMYIGVGDRDNPELGGTGRIYIDDIRLTRRMP